MPQKTPAPNKGGRKQPPQGKGLVKLSKHTADNISPPRPPRRAPCHERGFRPAAGVGKKGFLPDRKAFKAPRAKHALPYHSLRGKPRHFWSFALPKRAGRNRTRHRTEAKNKASEPGKRPREPSNAPIPNPRGGGRLPPKKKKLRHRTLAPRKKKQAPATGRVSAFRIAGNAWGTSASQGQKTKEIPRTRAPFPGIAKKPA